jgi:hypothetical protein
MMPVHPITSKRDSGVTGLLPLGAMDSRALLVPNGARAVQRD